MGVSVDGATQCRDVDAVQTGELANRPPVAEVVSRGQDCISRQVLHCDVLSVG